MARSSERFPREERMRAQWEFDRVRRSGQVFSGRYVVFSALRDHGDRARRVGFIVSKRIGNAVTRNRLKRWFREVYRTHRAYFSEGIRLVLIARRPSARASFTDIKIEIIKLNIKFKRKIKCSS